MRLTKCFSAKLLSDKKNKLSKESPKKIISNKKTLMFKVVFFVFKIKSKNFRGNKAFWLINSNIGHTDITQFPKIFFDIFKPVFSTI